MTSRNGKTPFLYDNSHATAISGEQWRLSSTCCETSALLEHVAEPERAARIGRHVYSNSRNCIPSARRGATPRRNSLSRCENCPVARPEHAAEEFIPVSTKNATERALGRSCSSCVDVSFFAGHPHEMPSTAGDAFPGSAAPPEQEAGSPFPTGSRSRIAKSAPTDSRG